MEPVHQVCGDDRQNCLEESEQPEIIEEIEVEELAVDGICGVY